MTNRPPYALPLATAILLGLTACGGGGGGSTTTATTTPTTPTTPTVTTTSFSGTAATGAAMAGATINITCVKGSGSATTAANGSYTASLADITLPCALKATSADGATVLYSVSTPTTTASTSQVANITPMTQLLVASLTGTNPATFFTSFSTMASSVTAASVATAQTAVLNTLRDAGINVSSVGDILIGALVPATSSSSGNAYDVALDALKAQLTASGTTLATLTTTVAAASPVATGATTPTTNATTSLPASLLLKAADSNCSGLRTGDYWVFSPKKNGSMTDQFTTGSFDASTRTLNGVVGSSTLLTNNNGSASNCRYIADDTLSDVVVSKAGVILARVLNSDGTTYRITFAIPKQTISVAELAGTWNALGFELNDAGTAYAADMFSATINSSGVASDISYCSSTTDASTCAPETTTVTFSTNSAGGFTMTGIDGSDTWTDRAFAYRAGNGELMLIEVAGDGSISAWTQKRTLSLPAVNSIGIGNWAVRITNGLVATMPMSYSGSYTVTAVDAATSSVTRLFSDSSVQTVVQNNPRTGYNYRAPASGVTERTSLNLRGSGLSVQSVPGSSPPGSNAYQLSVDH